MDERPEHEILSDLQKNANGADAHQKATATALSLFAELLSVSGKRAEATSKRNLAIANITLSVGRGALVAGILGAIFACIQIALTVAANPKSASADKNNGNGKTELKDAKTKN